CWRCWHVAVHAGDWEEVSAHQRYGRRASRPSRVDSGGCSSPGRKSQAPRQLAVGCDGLQSWDGGNFSRHRCFGNTRSGGDHSPLSITHLRFCIEEFLCRVSCSRGYCEEQRSPFSVLAAASAIEPP